MSWSLFCWYSTIFQLCIKDGNDFSQFSQTEVNETQGYAISRYKLFTVLFVMLAQINSHGELGTSTIPWYSMSSSVAHKLHPIHTRIIPQSVVYKIIFQDFIIRWTEMFVWLLVAIGGFPSARANNSPKSTLLKLKYFVLSCWQHHHKSVSAFLKFSISCWLFQWNCNLKEDF